MAVRLFEGKDHAVSYLQYRVTPHEMISKIMSYVEQKVGLCYISGHRHRASKNGTINCLVHLHTPMLVFSLRLLMHGSSVLAKSRGVLGKTVCLCKLIFRSMKCFQSSDMFYYQ